MRGRPVGGGVFLDAWARRDQTIGMSVPRSAPVVIRHACPTLAAPMRTGDGYLARLPPLPRAMAPDQLAGIAAAARRHGNGLVEISKRGNFQIRGVPEQGGPALATELAALGLDLPGGIPITVDPLGELHPLPIDPAALVGALHARLDETGLPGRLAPKLSIVLDFGTRFRPAALTADLRFRFEAEGVRVGLGGDDRSADWIGFVPQESVVDAAMAILACLAAAGPLARLSGPRGLREPARFRRALEPVAAGARIPARTSRPASIGSASVLEIAFPFGQSEAGPLARLADAARAVGIAAIAPAPERRLLLAGDPETALKLGTVAGALGFIVGDRDPRLSLSACIGSEGCSSGSIPARTLAARLAKASPDFFDGSFHLHLAGCGKGCAHPGPAAITLSAIDKGVTIVLDGRAGEPGSGIIAAEALLGRIAALAREAGRLRLGGERSGEVLARMGRTRIEAVLFGAGSIGETGNGPERDGDGNRLSA